MEKIWQSLLGVIALLILLFFIIWLFLKVDHGFLGGVIAGLVPSFITLFIQKQTIEHDHQKWLLSDKKAYIIETMHILSSMLAGRRRNKPENMEKLVRKFESLRPALITWGSASMIRAWEELQKVSSDDPNETHRRMERFLRAIRKEAGCHDSKLKPGEVTCIFLREEDKQMVLDACKDETYP